MHAPPRLRLRLRLQPCRHAQQCEDVTPATGHVVTRAQEIPRALNARFTPPPRPHHRATTAPPSATRRGPLGRRRRRRRTGDSAASWRVPSRARPPPGPPALCFFCRSHPRLPFPDQSSSIAKKMTSFQANARAFLTTKTTKKKSRPYVLVVRPRKKKIAKQ